MFGKGLTQILDEKCLSSLFLMLLFPIFQASFDAGIVFEEIGELDPHTVAGKSICCVDYVFSTQLHYFKETYQGTFLNIVGKEENAVNQHFLLFPHCFSTILIIFDLI